MLHQNNNSQYDILLTQLFVILLTMEILKPLLFCSHATSHKTDCILTDSCLFCLAFFLWFTCNKFVAFVCVVDGVFVYQAHCSCWCSFCLLFSCEMILDRFYNIYDSYDNIHDSQNKYDSCTNSKILTKWLCVCSICFSVFFAYVSYFATTTKTIHFDE